VDGDGGKWRRFAGSVFAGAAGVLEHDLCFDAAADGNYTLYYGDPRWMRPITITENCLSCSLRWSRVVRPGAVQSQYEPRQTNGLHRAHPILLWVALILVILTLAELRWVRQSARSSA